MQIHLDLGLSEDTPIDVPQFKYQAETMQVPRGQYSILSALWHGDVTAAEALVYLALNHQSYWDSGLTWCIATRELSRSLGMSVRYSRSVLEGLRAEGWIHFMPLENGQRRYRLVHHNCVADEVPKEGGKPLKFAVPRGAGGPFERLAEGEITWKACLVWIVYKLHSDWQTGITDACTIGVLATFCRIKRNTIPVLLKELEGVEMLKRLSAARQKSLFQLYPMPDPESVKPKKKKPVFTMCPQYKMTTDGVHWYSHNRQYRCNRETLEIQRRRGNGNWSGITDRERHQLVPKRILSDFESTASIGAAVFQMESVKKIGIGSGAQRVPT